MSEQIKISNKVRRHGLSYEAFLEFNRLCLEGKKGLVVGIDYVAMPSNQYKSFIAERDRYKEALKTIEALNHSGHYIEGEPGEHENKGCLASDLAQSALAQTEGA